MEFSAYSLRDLQACRGVIKDAKKAGLTLDQLDAELDTALPSVPQLSVRSASLNRAITCPVCNSQAVKATVNTNPGNQVDGPWTHAIQCQNRPAKDRPWLPRHCGHTEYIVEAR